VTSQRPDALPLADVPTVLLSRKLDVVPLKERAVIRQLAAQLACDLDGLVTCAVSALSSTAISPTTM
jgi:hypothetical protein